MTEPTTPDIAPLIARNIVIGIVIMAGIVFAGGVITGLEPAVAFGVAVLPGLVAGPFIGGMLTVAAFRDHDEAPASSSSSSSSGQAPT